MEIDDYLKDELKRLNRRNDLLEQNLKQSQAFCDEPNQIVNNIDAMCEIVKTIKNSY